MLMLIAMRLKKLTWFWGANNMNMQFIPSLSQETYAPRFTDFSVDTSEIHPLENNEVGFRLVLTGSTLGTVYLDAVVTANDAKSSTICNHTIDPQNDFSVDLDSLQVNTEMLCTVNDSGNITFSNGVLYIKFRV